MRIGEQRKDCFKKKKKGRALGVEKEITELLKKYGE
jgi:hypothetical protein